MLRRPVLCYLALAMTLCTTSLLANEDRSIDRASVIRDDWMRQAAARSVQKPLTAEDDVRRTC